MSDNSFSNRPKRNLHKVYTPGRKLPNKHFLESSSKSRKTLNKLNEMLTLYYPTHSMEYSESIKLYENNLNGFQLI